MINKYAIEAINKSGGPIRTHKFYLTKDSAKEAAKEVLATHFGMKK